MNQFVGCRLNCKTPRLVRACILPSSGVTQERLTPYSLCRNEELALKNKGRLVLDYFKQTSEVRREKSRTLHKKHWRVNQPSSGSACKAPPPRAKPSATAVGRQRPLKLAWHITPTPACANLTSSICASRLDNPF